MIFDALYFTDNENDDGYRAIEAANLQDAKAVLKAQMAAEGITYRLEALVETASSFANRR